MELQELELLLRLIIAHLLADFVFQTNKIVEGKKEGLQSKYFYIHVGIVGLLTYVFLANWSNVWLPLVVAIIHGLIDWGKVSINKNNAFTYLADQVLHFITLVVVWLIVVHRSFEGIWQFFSNLMSNDKILVVIIAYLLISYPIGILIGYITKQWQDELGDYGASLKDAGKWIGVIERILILTFILNGEWRAIGFLLAAKSVFRFGDLKDTTDRKKTEYILIGTLLSFTFSIMVGILSAYLMEVL